MTIYREQRLAGHPAVADFYAETAITQLLQFLSRQAPDDRTDNARQRRRAVRRVVEWAAQRDQCPVSVSELSRMAGVSSPTLYRGFMEEFGIGPKRYLNIRRLSRVRAELLSADPDVCIAEIANGWGFWHMGQFAADYRQHFGELPSETRGKR